MPSGPKQAQTLQSAVEEPIDTMQFTFMGQNYTGRQLREGFATFTCIHKPEDDCKVGSTIKLVHPTLKSKGSTPEEKKIVDANNRYAFDKGTVFYTRSHSKIFDRDPTSAFLATDIQGKLNELAEHKPAHESDKPTYSISPIILDQSVVSAPPSGPLTPPPPVPITVQGGKRSTRKNKNRRSKNRSSKNRRSKARRT